MSEENRRKFLKNLPRRLLPVAAGTLLGTADKALPYSDPIGDGRKVETGKATNDFINMALMNLINDEFAKELKEFVDEDNKQLVTCSKDLSLAVISCPNGQERAFQRVDKEIDEATGGKAILFREVDPEEAKKCLDAPKDLAPIMPRPALRLLFPGQSETNDNVGEKDKLAIEQILAGSRSPQIQFVHRYIEKLRKDNYLHLDDVEIFGHSLGAPNALYAKHILSAGRRCGATLFEPLGATQEAHFILDATKEEPGVGPKTIALQYNVNTVRSYPPTLVAQLSPGNGVSNKPFGDAFYWIDSGRRTPYIKGAVGGGLTGGVIAGSLTALATKALSSERSDTQQPTHRFSRRKLLKGTAEVGAAAVAANIGATVGEAADAGLLDENSQFHDTAANAKIIYTKKDVAFTRNDKELATEEEVLNPKKFSASIHQTIQTDTARLGI